MRRPRHRALARWLQRLATRIDPEPPLDLFQLPCQEGMEVEDLRTGARWIAAPRYRDVELRTVRKGPIITDWYKP